MIQIMSALMGCRKTAERVNVVPASGSTQIQREDVYGFVGDMLGIDRDVIKKPILTTFYGSKRQPAQALKDNPIASVEDFYQILYEHLEGAMVCMEVMQNCWQSKSLVHEWTLPDGHVAHVRVMDTVNKKVEIDELNHATFTYRCEVNTPLPTGLSLAANIIHSIDGYIVREMYRLAERQRFELLSIHDSFWASPEYMNNVRDNYRDIMISIYESDLLQHILREITGLNGVIPKGDTTMAKDMQRSVYMLS